ncbi:hypothetical protein [Streptomyces sp. NPDC001315]|uniref:hypothetical protein n=1 Tax=Streptomyces sp. NPDC001315 TaxID=3364562 RepID=UPI0036CDD021
MGRRTTTWWRAVARRGCRSAPARAVAAGAALWTVVTAASGQGAAAAPLASSEGSASAFAVSASASAGSASASSASASGYAFAADARTVTGATSTADAARLDPGETYRSTLPRSGKVYYRLELDATSSAYASATAVPAPDAAISAVDGIRVSVQDSDSHSCSYDSAIFGAARSPHPIAAWGAREVSPAKTLCQEAGTYYVVVERIGTTGSSPQDWGLELAAFSEPPLEKAGATSAPEAWSSASPAPLADEPEGRKGGAGFDTATTVEQGAWRSDIAPGQTLFYKVPVHWGRQLYATADLGSASKGSGYAVGALVLSLYNPVRAHVEDVGTNYDGSQKSATLAPLPPVRYANRYDVADAVSTMRFAGSYYLVVHLAAQVADRFGEGPFGLTLRVGVGGAGEPGPGYAGQSLPRGVFDVTAGDRAASGGAAGGDTVMKAVAVGGIGTGSVLLLVLGMWTATARRRAAREIAQMRVNAQKPTA